MRTINRLRLALALLAAAFTGACASDYRTTMGPTWVAEQAAERARLEAEGFPQFTGAN
jgi:hypothetical protein